MYRKTILIAALAGALSATPAGAQQVYKIGISAGLTGYAATVDRAWRDGVDLAVATLNAKGGVMGRKLDVVAEDNRSEPQEAVTIYRKMISSDAVNVFISGCVSAGNFAAAGLVARAQIPMVLCSILPQQPDHVKWAFSTLPPAGMEVEKRLEYLKEKTQIKKIGILHDPTPYAGLQKTAAEKLAGSYGLEIVGIEQYKQDDADMSVQISKCMPRGRAESSRSGSVARR
jgi:branched-chain amino acid transport system substrate-binding protein